MENRPDSAQRHAIAENPLLKLIGARLEQSMQQAGKPNGATAPPLLTRLAQDLADLARLCDQPGTAIQAMQEVLSGLRTLQELTQEAHPCPTEH